MNLATVMIDGTPDWGGIAGEDFISLSAHYPEFPTLSDVAAAGALSRVAEAHSGDPATHKAGSFTFLPPLPAPGKIICVGVNFPDRNAEYKDGSDAPQYMSLFPRFISGFVGHRENLVRPPESDQLDYEGEIAVVIGTGGRRIPEAEAYDHIAALTLCNEGTIRDWIRHAKFNVTQGKNWDRSGAMGPYLVPFRSADQVADIRLTTHVNGELRQDDRTGRMLFSIPRQIAYISTFTTLRPGDIIVTGTPTGAGARFDPPQFLVPGDVVEVAAEGMGTLRNGVEDER